jgi:hypothetical protein
MPPVEFEPTISAGERQHTYALGYGYIGAKNDTTQQSGQTPDKEVEIKNITVYFRFVVPCIFKIDKMR